jgi:hypothetical protein
MILGDFQLNHPSHLENSIKKLGSLWLEDHIGLYTLYGCQIEIICFFFFSALHLFLRISLSKVCLYQNDYGIRSILQFYQFGNLTHKCI